MGDGQNEQLPASQVESVDSSEQSIDEQLVSIVQGPEPSADFDPNRALEYATPPRTKTATFTPLGIVVNGAGLLLLLFYFVGVGIQKMTFNSPRAIVSPSTIHIANLETALDAFMIDNGRYPTSMDGLAALVQSPANLTSSWRGPYVKSVPSDPWGRTYLYRSPGTHHPNSYDLSSAGADGVAETADDIANWEVRAR